jgi:peptide chain release factor
LLTRRRFYILHIQSGKAMMGTAQLNLLKQQFQSQWTNQLAVERGNPIRTFEGSDFKKLKVEKKFKAVRQQLKNELRRNE